MSTHKEHGVLQESTGGEEIDLIAMWQVLVKYKIMISWVVFFAATLAVGVSLIMTNVYRAEILLAPASASDSKSNMGGLGGLASIAGLSLGGGGSDTEENLAVLQSREFLWQFVKKNNLMPTLFEDEWDATKKRWRTDDPKKIPNQWDVYRVLMRSGKINVSVEKKTQLVTIGVEWSDPILAAQWANILVEQLNEYLAQQKIARSERNLKYLNEELARTQIEEMRTILFELIAGEQKNAMMANTQKEFAFKVLDPAIAPDNKIKPKRAIIVVVVTVLAGLVAIFVAFVREAVLRRRIEIDSLKETCIEN